MANNFLAALLSGISGGLNNYAGNIGDEIKSKRDDEKLAKQIELFKQKSDLGLRNAGLLLGAKDILKDGGSIDFTGVSTADDLATALSQMRQQPPQVKSPKFSFSPKPARVTPVQNSGFTLQNPYAAAAAAEMERRKRAKGL